MKKGLFASIITLSVATLLLQSLPVHADGVLIPPSVDDKVYETGQKAVIFYKDGRETLIVSTTFEGDSDDFVWVIPVPSKPEVEKSKDELFTSLEDYTRPAPPEYDSAPLIGSVSNVSYERVTPKVQVIETKKIDIYEIAVLEANDADALRNWLNEHGFDYPENKSHLLDHYIQKNWYFVAARIIDSALSFAPPQLKTGHAAPLAITFDSPNIIYPLRISGLASDNGILGAYSFEDGFQQWAASARPSREGEEGYPPLTRYIQSSIDEVFHGDSSLLLAEGDIPIATVTSPIDLNNQFEYGGRYVFSGYIKIKNPQNSKIYIQISNNEGPPLQILNPSEYSEWKRFEYPFTYDHSGKLSIQVRDAEGDSIYLDALQVEKGFKASEFRNEKFPPYTRVNKPVVNTDPDSPVKIILYVFSDKKQSVPGFNTEFADEVREKDYKNFALKDNGDPWIDTEGKYFLTKLTNTLPPSQMVEDLILREASDQSEVNARSLGFPLLAGVFLLMIISSEMIIALYFWRRYSKKGREF